APGQIAPAFPAGAPTMAPAANAAGLVISSPYGNYLISDPALARSINGDGLCNILGLACTIPGSNPLGTWDIAEQTRSGYVMAKFKSANRLLDGNVGLRVVSTSESVSGYRTALAGGVAPIRLVDRYTDILPSMNLRYALAPGLYVRGALSKTITRQDFNKFSPSMTLNPAQLNITVGNPALKPVRADNLDLAVEKYFNETTSIHATGFWKSVDGFVTSVVNPETYGGVRYQVTRFQNSTVATINGLELGYQQFYDFLPGWLSGLGLQANYTYAESGGTTNTLTGLNQPLTNLSRHSYNLVGMYEKGDISARVAYNWRDRFWNSLGAAPIYTQGYGWLDASVSYRFSGDLTLAIEGLNLLRTVRRSYYGAESRPQSVWMNDMQISAALTAKF
ncbi:MAG TPA: TonB-dependent receptor, partial [Gallionella sp.]|nr:TonB-dependent receptor [Gallionella sp.]